MATVVNFKYGVTPNLIADFTLNPDFSQIESDRPQVEVNQRFALYFPELRPFFLEGTEIFQVQAPVTVVHTRTIVDPQYGAKLTGKAGKTTMGVLVANDQAAGLGVDDAAVPALGQSAQTVVGRVRYDLYSESFVGAVFTDREFLDGYSRLAGIDSNFQVGSTHQMGFRALGTQRRDAQEGIQTDGYLLDFGVRKRGRNLSYSLNSLAVVSRLPDRRRIRAPDRSTRDPGAARVRVVAADLVDQLGAGAPVRPQPRSTSGTTITTSSTNSSTIR